METIIVFLWGVAGFSGFLFAAMMLGKFLRKPEPTIRTTAWLREQNEPARRFDNSAGMFGRKGGLMR